MICTSIGVSNVTLIVIVTLEYQTVLMASRFRGVDERAVVETPYLLFAFRSSLGIERYLSVLETTTSICILPYFEDCSSLTIKRYVRVLP